MKNNSIIFADLSIVLSSMCLYISTYTLIYIIAFCSDDANHRR